MRRAMQGLLKDNTQEKLVFLVLNEGFGRVEDIGVGTW